MINSFYELIQEELNDNLNEKYFILPFKHVQSLTTTPDREYFFEVKKDTLIKDLTHRISHSELFLITKNEPFFDSSYLEKLKLFNLKDLIRKYGRHLNLQGADLKGIQLEKVNLKNADLSYCQLQGANLKNANLKNVNLTQANLEGCNLVEANLFRANMTKTDLRRANLTQAELRETNLNFTFFRGAELWSASMWSVDVSMAHMEGTDLSRADTRGT